MNTIFVNLAQGDTGLTQSQASLGGSGTMSHAAHKAVTAFTPTGDNTTDYVFNLPDSRPIVDGHLFVEYIKDDDLNILTKNQYNYKN